MADKPVFAASTPEEITKHLEGTPSPPGYDRSPEFMGTLSSYSAAKAIGTLYFQVTICIPRPAASVGGGLADAHARTRRVVGLVPRAPPPPPPPPPPSPAGALLLWVWPLRLGPALDGGVGEREGEGELGQRKIPGDLLLSTYSTKYLQY